MSLDLLTEGPWEAIENALLEHLGQDRGRDPFDERWILIPHLNIGRHLQRRIAADLGQASGLRWFRFQDVAKRVLQGGGPGTYAELSTLARDLVLRRVLEELTPSIERSLESGSLSTPAFADAVKKTLNDLREAGIEPSAVSRMARKRKGRGRKRLEAVSALYEGYVGRLEGLGVADREGLMGGARGMLEEGTETDCAELLVYGFYDLTGGQMRLLDALIESIPTVMYVPVYSETIDYAGRLLELWRAKAAKVESLPTEEFPSLEPCSLDELWKKPPSPGAGDRGTLTVVSAPGKGREVDTALRLVAAAWHGGAVKDDTLLAAHEPRLYEGLTKQQAQSNAFGYVAGDHLSSGLSSPGDSPGEATGIEGSRREAVLRILLSALRVLGDEVSSAEITALLNCVIADGGREPVPLLGETLLGEIRGARTLDDWISELGRAEERIRTWADSLLDSETAGDEVPLSTEARIRRLRARADSLGKTAENLDRLRPGILGLPGRARWGEWAARLRELACAVFDPSFHGDIDEILEILRELAVLGEDVERDTVRWALGRLLSDNLPESPVPVQNLMDLRGTRSELVVVLGMVEGSWPRKPSQDPLLLDRERTELAGGEEWLLPTSRHRVREDRVLFRLVLETGKRIVLLYPRLDEGGAVRRASPHILSLMRGLHDPGLAQSGLEALAARHTRTLGDTRPRPGEPQMGDLDRDLSAVGNAIAGKDVGGIYALWESDTFRSGWRAELARWTGGPGPYSGFLTSESTVMAVRRMLGLGEDGSISPSLLEDYATCPWRVLVTRVFGLSAEDEEPEGLLDGAEMGQVLHDVLHAYVEEAAAEGRWPPDPEQPAADREKINRLVGERVRAAYRRRGGMFPTLERVDGRRAQDRVLGWLVWEAGEAAGEEWGVHALEEWFTTEVEIARSRLRVRGRWDRVDRNKVGQYRVIDYKTGRSSPGEPGDLGGGLNLQMLLYMLAAGNEYGSGDDIAGGTFVHLRPGSPGDAPRLYTWSAEMLAPGREKVEALVNLLLESMRAGVFVRLPHRERTEQETGLCGLCPTPAICRAWRIEESRRHVKDELLHGLHTARRIGRVEGGGRE